MDERLARLMEPYLPGERVRAVETIVYGTGEEVAEGTVGHVQKNNVHGCTPLVTVAWNGRGGDDQPPHILLPCSAESLEPVDRERLGESIRDPDSRAAAELRARRSAAEQNAKRFGWCVCPQPMRFDERSGFCMVCDKVVPVP